MWEFLQLLFIGYYDRLFFALVCLIVVGAAVWDIKNRKFPPGPTGLPVLGYLPSLNAKTPYKQLTTLTHRFGRVYGIQLGSVYSVVVADVKIIKEAFANAEFKPKSSLGYFLNTVDDKNDACEIAEENNKVTSALKSVMASPVVPAQAIECQIKDSVRDFLQEVRDRLGKDQDITPVLKEVVGRIMIGITVGKLFDSDPSWPVLQSAFDQTSELAKVTNAINYVPMLRKMPSYAKQIRSCLSVRHKSRDIYSEVIQHLSKSTRSEANESVLGVFINEMRKCGHLNTIESEALPEVLLDFVNEEWEKTFTTLSWLYWYMALYPAIQETIAMEVEKVVGRKREVNLKDLELLPYTEATILELWRHQTILPFGVPRAVKQKTKIGDYEVPGDTLVIPLLWAVNHDSRLWENPDVYSPERFLFEDGCIFRNENLLPIPAGNSGIFGNSLSLKTTSLFLANTLNQFQIQLSQNYDYNLSDDFNLGSTLVPKPYHLSLQQRYK